MQITPLITATKFTIILGKNGSGKSTLLRKISEQDKKSKKYISPERGGTLKYDPGIDNNITSNPNWLEDTRQQNRFEQFRQQSAAQFRNLELLVLREIEKDSTKRSDASYTFDRIIDKINSLLPAIKLIRSEKGFSIISKQGQPIQEEQVSSGEAELIALTIEVLVFSRSSLHNRILLLDEPDVHLHPDLQHKFIEFVESVASENDFRVVIATHSTAIISAFSMNADLQIIPMSKRDQVDFFSFKRSSISENILPVFGIHPLSTAFNKSPILLVEGEDDRRVFEQMVRSGNGKFSLSPCVVGSVSEMNKWEKWLTDVLPVIYDSPKAFSLRDLDDSQQSEINDFGFVCRIRLNCYSIENILLSDDCLIAHGITDIQFKTELQKWVSQFPSHPFAAESTNLLQHFEDRRLIKVKGIRNIIVMILNSTKPWEVIVGKAISNFNINQAATANSIGNYLGNKLITSLLK
jgi:energy-coupling factor transporter ATP-binding protein EcfA2